jgi:hypothetical protein
MCTKIIAKQVLQTRYEDETIVMHCWKIISLMTSYAWQYVSSFILLKKNKHFKNTGQIQKSIFLFSYDENEDR